MLHLDCHIDFYITFIVLSDDRVKDIEIRMKAAQQEHDQAAELAQIRQEQQEAEIARLKHVLELTQKTGILLSAKPDRKMTNLKMN